MDAEREILTKEITKGDEILVLVSDGVFEFLMNQRVIDICAECDDPLFWMRVISSSCIMSYRRMILRALFYF